MVTPPGSSRQSAGDTAEPVVRSPSSTGGAGHSPSPTVSLAEAATAAAASREQSPDTPVSIRRIVMHHDVANFDDLQDGVGFDDVLEADAENSSNED